MAATITADVLIQPDDAVARAASAPFAVRGETVAVMPVADLAADGSGVPAADPGLHAVVVADRRRLECIVADPGADGLGAVLDGLAGAGWEVVALVPAAEIGSAHRHLRGTGATLQPWWREADGIRFGRPERP